MEDTRLKRNEYYNMLRHLKNDFLKTTTDTGSSYDGFSDYVEEVTGIRMRFEGNMITENYTVVDREKFFLYKLKE